MAFKAKTPAAGMRRSQPLTSKSGLQSKTSLQSKTGLSAKSGLQTQAVTPEERRAQEKKALQKRTLRALDKARQAAAEQGVELSEWEDAFIDSVSERVKTYGRAFADPDKGAMNGTLSLRQGIKLREIRQKADKKEKTRP
ncbi:hypothetical protein [Asticcacaulis sp. EMRT-3]|uniref:hypothetical protein n=1 Tax=Asticcacaulis sp. EMRT-3 TaxID=3040349 RepID=UPI0024AFB7E0|nr:hypothetical protein [Asticcacaulis sp. EMRT-3]MDI7774283.1 hypothetical protein [Asticcacaulis sp. EMRT-3]